MSVKHIITPKLFLEYVFEKNQASAIPAKREIFYNIAQEIIHEINIMVDKEGESVAFCKIKIAERHGRPSYSRE